MDDNQTKTDDTALEGVPAAAKTNIDFKLLATVILLFLVSIFVVFALGVRMNKPAPILPTAGTMEIPTMTSVEEDLDLPADWLEEVPVTPDAAETEVVEDFGLASSSVTFTTKQTEAEAIAYYKADIVAKGGKITDTLETEAKKIIVANTADGSLYVVYIGVVAGETTITININPVQ